jgi:hypothetical protein
MFTDPHVQLSLNIPQVQVQGHGPDAEQPPATPMNPPQLQLHSWPVPPSPCAHNVSGHSATTTITIVTAFMIFILHPPYSGASRQIHCDRCYAYEPNPRPKSILVHPP